MAIVKTVLAKDNRKAIVRVTATSAGNATIDIDADLKLTNETITSSALKVAIQKIEYSCQAAQDITVVRNSVLVATVHPGAPKIETSIQDEGDQDIVVTFSGKGMILLHLSKMGGFNDPVETPEFGAYDDQTAVGS
tara:strand:- start:641 stop:1048 length:408 start_codon:yes stop_codon:yes gene_type:complete